MDWSPPDDLGGAMPAEPAELQELSFSMLPASIVPGRRRISHKKSASDTFAFAAGQDILSFLNDRPLVEEGCHSRHASLSAELGVPGAANGGSRWTASTTQPLGAVAGMSRQVSGGSFNSLCASPTLSGQPVSPSAAGPNAAAAAASAHAATSAAAAAAGGDTGTQTRGNALDTTQLDPRKAKRILANRQSAQRSRMKRLQYINELEAKKSKAEAAIRDVRSRVDKAQKQQGVLSKEIEGYRSELATLQQHLLHEQGLQANLSSYMQSLQLQLQEQHQQQWGYTQDMASYQLQQAQCEVTVQGHNSSFSYSAAAASQYTMQQQQPYAASGPDPAALLQQQPQHWPSSQAGHSSQQQLLMQQQQQAASHAYSIQDVQTLQQHAVREQQPSIGVLEGAGAGAAATHGVPGHSRSIPWDAAIGTNGYVPGAAAAAAQQHSQHQQHQQLLQPPPSQYAAKACNQMAGTHGAAAMAGGRSSSAFLPGTCELTSPAFGAEQSKPPNSASAPQLEGMAAASRGSLSQGSGSVLPHASPSDPDLTSLLGLGASQLEAAGSPEICGLLSAGESGGFMLPADELLLRDSS